MKKKLKLTRKEMSELRGGFLPPCEVIQTFLTEGGMCGCGCQIMLYNWYAVGNNNSIDGITSPQCYD